MGMKSWDYLSAEGILHDFAIVHRSLNVRAPRALRDHLVRTPHFTSKGKRPKEGKGTCPRLISSSQLSRHPLAFGYMTLHN